MRILTKPLTYTLIFITIGMCGSFLADIMRMTGCPQHTRDFMYCCVITIFAIENWYLLSDLRKYEERYATKTLTRRCSIQRKQSNAPAPETLSEAIQRRPTPREDITTTMNTWVIYCNTESAPPPSMVLLVSPDDTKNTEKLSPMSIKFQHATPKVPPIKRGESL